MSRLTKFATPFGMVMTTLNSMKHYMPCVTCRHNAEIKYKNGEGYTEKFTFCETCEVKMLFNKLKEYEYLEEQGLIFKIRKRKCQMTPKEAIKILEVAKAEVEWNYPLDYAIAIDTAIEALEKQIPKKPITTTDGCKACSCGLVLQEDNKRRCFYYCDRCGQKID